MNGLAKETSITKHTRGFPGGSDGKESACNAGALGALGRSPGEGNGHPLHILAWEIPRIEEAPHSSILAWKNPMAGGAW